MIDIEIPGGTPLRLQYAVFDFNGTLALDGALRDGLAERLSALAYALDLHVVTADTFGTAASALAILPIEVEVVSSHQQSEAKRSFIEKLGHAQVVAIGNGRNDRLMLAAAGLSIAIVGGEGCAVEALMEADVVCADVSDAIDLLLNPRRLTATLRG
jgi:soluble P-type ATPase